MSERVAAIAQKLAAGDANGARAAADATLGDASLTTSERFNALILRSRAHEALRSLPLAIVDLEGALALDSSQARIWNELGILCADSGQIERAIDAFSHATRVDPAYARAWNNLGNALRTAGRIADALSAVERAINADPKYALAWANLGALRRDGSDDAAAETALRHALSLDPKQRGAEMTLGGLLRERSDLANAAAMFRRATELDPRDANAWLQLGQTLAERDELGAARDALRQAETRDPRMLRALFGRALVLPMVAQSGADAVAARESYTAGIAEVEAQAPRRIAGATADRVVDELRWSNFLLAYQGEDDRALQMRYGELVSRLAKAAAPQWAQPLPPRVRGASRRRIGFVSAFLRDGTTGRYFEHWITDLPAEDFEVFVYHLLPDADSLAQRVAARADHFRHCPSWRPSQVAPRVRADALDVLIYPELGMSAIAFALASLRLAPLQCAAWGHPVTTGLPAVDVFFSSAAMEPGDAQHHYSETLVTLPGIGTRYRAPQPPGDATRLRFSLPANVPLLLCPQSLFKIHPDNDALFANVLDAVPGALLVGFEGRDPALTAKFVSRLAHAGIASDRLRLLPQCSHDDFLRVNSMCDVMLDTLRWSGGNTTLDAIACGLPIVTLPGRFMRGRQSFGMLKLMGLDELVAADLSDYVRKVAAIASDVAYRNDLARRMSEARKQIFDDPAPVTALADWLASESLGDLRDRQ